MYRIPILLEKIVSNETCKHIFLNSLDFLTLFTELQYYKYHLRSFTEFLRVKFQIQ